MRILLIVLVAALLLGGLASCMCAPWDETCKGPYYQHTYGEVCPVCGGDGYYQGRCSRYETVWHGCEHCGQW